jgi:hypothetical protein
MTIDRTTIVNALSAAGLDDDALYTDYSGRAMYGDTCLGIVHDGLGELLTIVVELDRAGLELGWLANARQDSMGHSDITYFPGVTVEA